VAPRDLTITPINDRPVLAALPAMIRESGFALDI
jgi:hypothetical protein